MALVGFLYVGVSGCVGGSDTLGRELTSRTSKYLRFASEVGGRFTGECNYVQVNLAKNFPRRDPTAPGMAWLLQGVPPSHRCTVA